MSKHKILIVDDDPQIRQILTRLLQERYEIYEAAEGFAALEMAPQVKPDLVILDIMMPVISGIEVCKRLRAIFPQGLQIMMLSAKDSQNDRRVALEYGGDDYVTKPFHLNVLARKIDHMLGKAAS